MLAGAHKSKHNQTNPPRRLARHRARVGVFETLLLNGKEPVQTYSGRRSDSELGCLQIEIKQN